MAYIIRNENAPFLWNPSYRKPYSAKLEDIRKGKVIDQIFRNRKDCMECHQRHLNNNPYVGVLPNQNTLPENKAYKATDLTKPKRNRWGRRITPKGLQTVYMTLKRKLAINKVSISMDLTLVSQLKLRLVISLMKNTKDSKLITL